MRSMERSGETEMSTRRLYSKTSCWRKLFFAHMSETMTEANKRAMSQNSLNGGVIELIIIEDDLYSLDKENSATALFETFWQRYEATASMFKSVLAILGCKTFCQIGLLFLYNITQVRLIL